MSIVYLGNEKGSVKILPLSNELLIKDKKFEKKHIFTHLLFTRVVGDKRALNV